jgi:hypothetical protein
MDGLFNDLKSLIENFNRSLEAYLPALENDVDQLIREKCTNRNTIEYHLDTLLSLTMHGVGDKLYIRLIDYYKTIDAEGALFYWNEYDNQDE